MHHLMFHRLVNTNFNKKEKSFCIFLFKLDTFKKNHKLETKKIMNKIIIYVNLNV